MALLVEIASVDRTTRYRVQTLEIEKRWAVERMSADIVDRDDLTASAYRPQNGDEVSVTQDGGVFLFGGIIESVEDARALPPNEGATVTAIEARGFDVLATEEYVTEIFPPSTLLAVGFAIVDKYLAPKGITWTGPTSGGPATGEIRFEKQRVDAALTQLTTAFGWPWRIIGTKQAFFQDPNTIPPAPNSPLSATNCRVIGDTRWRREQLLAANRVLLQTGGSGSGTRTDDFGAVGDGVKTTFMLLVEPSAPPAFVIANSAQEPVDGGLWSWDASIAAVVRSSPLPAGHTLAVPYGFELPAWCRVLDGVALLANGGLDRSVLREIVIQGSEITEVQQALLYALGVLQRRVVPEQTATLRTTTPNWFPIQAVDLDFPDRLLTGQFIVQAVTIRDQGLDIDEPESLFYDLEVASGTLARRDWTEFWRERQATSGGGTALIAAPPPVSGTSPTGKPQIVNLGSSQIGYAAAGWFWPDGMAQMRLRGADYPNGARVIAGARLMSGGTTFQLRLQNVTQGASAGDSPTYSQTTTEEQLWIVTLQPGEELYQIQANVVDGATPVLILYAYVHPI